MHLIFVYKVQSKCQHKFKAYYYKFSKEEDDDDDCDCRRRKRRRQWCSDHDITFINTKCDCDNDSKSSMQVQRKSTCSTFKGKSWSLWNDITSFPSLSSFVASAAQLRVSYAVKRWQFDNCGNYVLDHRINAAL